jgi:hypothetical protein
MLSASLDGDGVRILPFEGDILLFNARQLAMELICLLGLFDIELGIEGLEAVRQAVWCQRSIGAIRIIRIFIEHPKHGSEFILRRREDTRNAGTGQVMKAAFQNKHGLTSIFHVKQGFD